MAFKVGDKVVNDVFGPGEIVYGPYGDADRSYFMKADNGVHHTVSAEFLKPAVKFEVGDKAKGRVSGREYEILAGPFFAPRGGEEWYAVEHPAGGQAKELAENLLPVEPADEAVKVGDVVRILEDGAYHADVKRGDLFEVKRVFSDGWDGETRIKVDAGSGARMDQWTFRPQDFEKVAADKVAVHEGVTYDLTARYVDRDGDYWSFKHIDDEVYGYAGTYDRDMSRNVTTGCMTLTEAARNYGPLTRA